MTCAICARDTDPKYRPFCSRRCADIDLGRWLTESYRLPGDPLEDDTPAEPDDNPRPQ